MTGRFALFADCLVIGVLAALTAVPVVTGYAGFVAACAALRDRITDDRPAGPRRFWMYLRAVAATGPAVFVVPPLVLALLAVDALALAAGAPGRAGLSVLLAACAAAATLLGLRLAAAWRPGTDWSTALRTAALRARAGVRGDILVLAAAGCAAGIAVVVPVAALFLAGPLAMAAVVVDAAEG